MRWYRWRDFYGLLGQNVEFGLVAREHQERFPKLLLFASNRKGSLANPLNGSWGFELCDDVGTGRRRFVIGHKLKVGAQEFLLMGREIGLRFETAKPLGSLSGEYERQAITVDLLPADAVNKHVDDASIDIADVLSELCGGRVGVLVFFEQLDVGPYHQSFLGAEGVFDQAGVEVFQ